MGAEDKIPVIFQEQNPCKAKKKCRKSLGITIGIILVLVAALAVVVVVGSIYITDLKAELDQLYDRAEDAESAKNEWNKHREKERTRRVRTNHPDMTVEAEQVWLETKEALGLGHITGKPIAIYRRDLDDDYIAYWELITNNTEYVIISAGKKTGDRKRVTQGYLPAMTQIVDEVAREYGEICFSYYMVSPDGAMMCDNSYGRIIATTFDNELLPESEFPDPHEYIEHHLADLEVMWVKHAYDVSNSGEWDDEDVSDPDHSEETTEDAEEEEEFAESAVVPGEDIIIAVGKVNSLVDFNIRYQPSNLNDTLEAVGETQFKLCQCSGICDDNDMFVVKRSLLKVDPDTGLGYLRFQICTAASQIFSNAEISFVIEISSKDGTFFRKRFGLEYESSRRKRYTEYSSWSAWSTRGIADESYFPDYNQFDNGKCYVGCASVAWAQLFAYFDRRSHRKVSRFGSGSQGLYRTGADGTTGSNDQIAPDSYYDNPDSKISGYTKKLAQTLKTFCLGKSGATPYTNMKRLSSFFKVRQTSGAPAIYDKSWILSITGIYRSTIASWARVYLNSGWPVIVGVREGGIFAQHYAVATQYRSRTRKYRRCFRRRFCFSWRTTTDIDMYTHQGWGGSRNRWRNMGMFYAVVAKY